MKIQDFLKKNLVSLIACLIAVVAIVIALLPNNAAPGKDGKDGINGNDGQDGVTPTVTISDDGYWVINGEKTNVKASSDEATDENPQGLQFYLQDDGTYIASCGDAKYLSNIVIPATYKGSAVVGIDNEAFYNCSSLTSVVIPNSVTSIGTSAFAYCSSLTSVVIPDSVTSIGKSAFKDCTALEEIYFNAVNMNDLSYENSVFYNAGENGDGIKVVIGKDVTKIPAYLFCPYNSSYSPKIISVEFEDGSVCTSIGERAFSGCFNLTSIVIPDSVTSIGDSAFEDCDSLTSVVIPDSVTSIGGYAFRDCYSLTSVVIPDSVTSIGDYAFSWCSSLTSIVIPDSVTSISDWAFEGCSSLTSVVIPDSVTNIGDSAFEYCSSLTDVYYTGSAEKWAEITIGYNNWDLTDATIHYNYVPEE